MVPHEDPDIPRLFVVLEDAREDGFVLVLDGPNRVLYDRRDLISVSDLVQEGDLEQRRNAAEDTVLRARPRQKGRSRAL
jgi:hypothetical protein